MLRTPSLILTPLTFLFNVVFDKIPVWNSSVPSGVSLLIDPLLNTFGDFEDHGNLKLPIYKIKELLEIFYLPRNEKGYKSKIIRVK